MRQAVLYYCVFSNTRQVFSRHYTAKLYVCRRIGAKSVNELSRALSPSDISRLVENGSIEIYDADTIKRLIGGEVEEGAYLKIVITQ